MNTLFNEALDQKLEIQEKGRTRKITAREGIAKRLVNEALKGNIRAAAMILEKEPEIIRSTKPKTMDFSRTGDPHEAVRTYLRIVKGQDVD